MPTSTNKSQMMKKTGADEAEGISGVGDVKETPGVDNETPENETESGKVEVQDNRTELMSGGMNLHRQPRKE